MTSRLLLFKLIIFVLALRLLFKFRVLTNRLSLLNCQQKLGFSG